MSRDRGRKGKKKERRDSTSSLGSLLSASSLDRGKGGGRNGKKKKGGEEGAFLLRCSVVEVLRRQGKEKKEGESKESVIRSYPLSDPYEPESPWRLGECGGRKKRKKNNLFSFCFLPIRR